MLFYNLLDVETYSIVKVVQFYDFKKPLFKRSN
jgi:hypothetical protein